MRVRPPAGVRELSEDDNERRKTVNVIDRKMHVLVVASGPMRDYRFLHTMLNRHSSIDVDIWLQTVSPSTVGQVSQESKRLLVEFPKTAAELFDYDVIVAFDPDWSRIPVDGRKFLMDWVSEHGGGLILVAGDIYTPQLAATTDDALKDLQKLYPVVLSASISELSLDAKSEQPWPVALTPEGDNAGFLQLADNSPDIKAQWHEFPGVYRCYPTAGSKKAATVYANFGDPRVQNEQGQPILFAAQFYGSGRILYIGSPEMWRLRGRRSVFRAILDQDDPRSRAGEASARHGPRLVALGAQPVRLGADGSHSGQFVGPAVESAGGGLGRAQCLRSSRDTSRGSADAATGSRNKKGGPILGRIPGRHAGNLPSSRATAAR